MDSIKFVWDDEKEKINMIKHGIDFDTAIKIFSDTDRIEKYDSVHSYDEDRYLTIGSVNDIALILMVVYTVRGNDTIIRIISARQATKNERKMDYDHNEDF